MNKRLIADFIRSRLDQNLIDSVVVVGLKGSGKTSILSSLIEDYSYFKYDKRNCRDFDWGLCSHIKIFDGSPIFDLFSSLKIETDECLLNMQRSFVREHITKYNNPMFVVYLHNLWDEGSSDSGLMASINNKYIDTTSIIRSLGYPIVVCTESKIIQYNTNYIKEI